MSRYFRHLEGLYALAKWQNLFSNVSVAYIQLPSSGNDDKEAVMHIKG